MTDRDRSSRPLARESAEVERPASAASMARPMRRAGSRPDARPARIAFGVGSVAALSALAAAIVAPPAPAADAVTTMIVPDSPAPSVQHIVRYVQLKPGQTAPPQAVVRQPATPKPRVVTIVTRQSGIK